MPSDEPTLALRRIGLQRLAHAPSASFGIAEPTARPTGEQFADDGVEVHAMLPAELDQGLAAAERGGRVVPETL